MKQSICITIRGHVQGVGFRYHALNQANEFEINGFVKNQPDGSVFIEAEGETESVDLFLEWCRQGPRWANIESVEIKPIESRNYNGFTVK
jgi:acylphosphatase